MKKQNQLRRVLALLCTVVLLLSSLAGCGDNTGNASGATEKTTFTAWLGRGEDSSAYSDYHDNPVLQLYLNQTYKGEDGKDVKVDMKFLVPPAGSEQDVYNTMMGTGEYCDVMSMAYGTTTPISDLYNDGIILDLTPYIEQYMPNYMKFLNDHPELALTATNIVDGEKKYLQLYLFSYQAFQTLGPVYRRDWIVTYGKHPTTGASFSGEYTIKNADGSWDTDSWVDDVVFPSGGTDPIYISDWEWMFGIFETAMSDLGIKDGYCISIGSSGYNAMGMLYNSFGGGGPIWYKDNTNNISFGGNSDEMRTYLQCMNTWYKNGWVDTAFAEHVGQMPFRIDEAKIRTGKVGAWLGIDNNLLNRLDTGDEYNKGIIVYAAPYPMNDIYGSAEQQNKAPYWMYQLKDEAGRYIVTNKAKDKDIPALLAFMDEMYAPENSIMNAWGLSKEQYEQTQDPYYTKIGMTNGAYYDSGEKDENGKAIYYRDPISANDTGVIYSASTFMRFVGTAGYSGTITMRDQRTDTYMHMRHLWTDYYTDTAWLQNSFTSQLSAADAKTVSSTQTKVEEFLAKNLPNFIKGDKDPYNDDQWNAYVNALNKYSPEKATAIYQALLDGLK